MPLLMQLDGPRPQPPQLLGLWSDIWGGLEAVTSAIGDTASDAWSSITDRRLKPMRIVPVRLAPSATIRGPLGVFVPATDNYYIGLLASNPWIPLLLGAGVGVFLATRKGKKR